MHYATVNTRTVVSLALSDQSEGKLLVPPALVVRAGAGSVAAFEEIVRRTGPALFRFLVVRLRDDDEAIDALQETLFAAWQGLPRLNAPDRFWPWIVGIAVHKAADLRRSQFDSDRRIMTSPITDRVSVDRQVDNRDDIGLRQALEEIPQPFLEVLLLRFLLGLSEAETASALGVRVGTVKSRTARAKRRLARALRQGDDST